MSKVLERAEKKLKNKTCFLQIRKDWIFQASSILDLETRLDETNMPTEARLKAQNALERSRKEWGIVYDIINDYEWPEKTIPPVLNNDDPLLEKMRRASNFIWPAIWILVENKNRRVAENYFLDELLDLDTDGWDNFRREKWLKKKLVQSKYKD